MYNDFEKTRGKLETVLDKVPDADGASQEGQEEGNGVLVFLLLLVGTLAPGQTVQSGLCSQGPVHLPWLVLL